MLVLGVVLLLLLKGVQFCFQVTHLGLVSSSLGCFDVGLVLLTVLGDRFHGNTFLPWPPYGRCFVPAPETPFSIVR